MKSHSIITIILLLGLTSFMAPPAVADWSTDPDVNNPVCRVSGDQVSVQSISDGLGGAIIAWRDDRGGDFDIYVQRIDSQGDPLWNPTGVPVCTAADDQEDVRLTSDGDGGAILVWEDARDSTEVDLYAQRVERGGDVAWATDGVPIAREPGYQLNPYLVSDDAGGAIFCWQDERDGTYDIYAQRLNGSGVRQWANGGVPVCNEAFDQLYARLVGDGAGGAIFCWEDQRHGASEADIFCQRLDSGGVAQWTANGKAVCTAADSQTLPVIATDGSGGAFIAWKENRTSAYGYDIYIQRVLADGSMDLDTDGEQVCGSAADPFYGGYCRLVSDGDGGAIVAWTDEREGMWLYNIYAQRVLSNGNMLWTTDGVSVCTASDYQYVGSLAVNAAGEVTISWSDYRGVDLDIYVQRLDPYGFRQWDEDGMIVCSSPDNQTSPALVGSDDDSVIVAWQDYRTGLGADVYAQLIERHGQLGDPAPVITEIVDYPDDQGGVVVLSWAPSYLDAYPRQLVSHYSVWRRIPPLRGGEADPERSGWAHVEDIPAYYWDEYGSDAPTYGIYGGSGPEWTDYKVVAHTADQWVYWESAVDRGSSTDNLAPGAPLDLSGTPSGSDVELAWNASGSHDEDLAYYRIYRGTTPGFTPDAGSLVGTAADTAFTDPAPGSGTWYYLVTAEDVHGNEGQTSNETSAVITPSATLAASLDCQPGSGVVPFVTQMTVTMDNLYTGQIRRFAARIDVQLAGGASYPSWRAGFTNVAAGDSFSTSWNQNIPALGTLIGDNVFGLSAADVTPAPYNQPPYPPSGDTAADDCRVTALAP